MGYYVKTRYYAAEDNFGESYVLTSDNLDDETKYEIGETVYINKWPMNKDPFDWMRGWLNSYAKENELNVDEIMEWIFSQPMTKG